MSLTKDLTDKSVVKENSYSEFVRIVKSALDAELANGSDACRLKLISITITYPYARMFGALSPLSHYLSALSFTFSQALEAIPSKFMNYVALELNAELPMYLANSWAANSLTFLSTKRDELSTHMSSHMRDERYETREPRAPIPFTTLVSSSLGASILLWLALAVEKILQGAYYIRRFGASFFSKSTAQAAVFTSLGVTIIVAVLSFRLSVVVLEFVWRALFAGLG